METLDILVLWKGSFPTYASTQTIFAILKADWFYLVNNEYVAVGSRRRARVVVPGQHGTGADRAVGRHAATPCGSRTTRGSSTVDRRRACCLTAR